MAGKSLALTVGMTKLNGDRSGETILRNETELRQNKIEPLSRLLLGTTCAAQRHLIEELQLEQPATERGSKLITGRIIETTIRHRRLRRCLYHAPQCPYVVEGQYVQSYASMVIAAQGILAEA